MPADAGAGGRDMQPMEMHFDLSEEEIRRSLREVWKRKKLIKTAIFAAVFLLLSVDFFWSGSFFVGAVSLAAGAAVIGVPLYGINKAAAQSAAAHLHYRVELGETECTIDVRSPNDGEGRPYDVGYEEVYAVYETADFFLLCMTREKIIPLPRKNLSTEENQRAASLLGNAFRDKYKAK